LTGTGQGAKANPGSNGKILPNQLRDTKVLGWKDKLESDGLYQEE